MATVRATLLPNAIDPMGIYFVPQGAPPTVPAEDVVTYQWIEQEIAVMMYSLWLANIMQLEGNATAVSTIIAVLNNSGPRTRVVGAARRFETLKKIETHVADQIELLLRMARTRRPHFSIWERKPTHPTAINRLRTIFTRPLSLPDPNATPLPTFPVFANPQYVRAYGNPPANHAYYPQSQIPLHQRLHITRQYPIPYQSAYTVAAPAPPGTIPQMPQHHNPYQSVATAAGPQMPQHHNPYQSVNTAAAPAPPPTTPQMLQNPNPYQSVATAAAPVPPPATPQMLQNPNPTQSVATAAAPVPPPTSPRMPSHDPYQAITPIASPASSSDSLELVRYYQSGASTVALAKAIAWAM